MNKNRIPCKILFDQIFFEKDILIEVSEKFDRIKIPEIEKKMNKYWKKYVSECETQGKKIWNGKTYRLHDFEIVDKKLSLKLGITEYKIQKCQREFFSELPKNDDKYLDRGMFSSALLKTIDDKYIFGKTSGKNTDSFSISFIGGGYSKSELQIKNSTDLFENNFKEIFEETGIDKKYVKNCKLIGAILTDVANVGFIFETNLNIDSDTSKKIFESQKNDEISELIFVEKNDLKNFLNERGRFMGFVNHLIK